MDIIDLTENFHKTYFLCLEDWSDEIKETGNIIKVFLQKTTI